MVAEIFRPKYTNSWALVIGINKYQYVSPLQFARNDAEAVAELLSTQFNFPESNVHLLVDEKASRMNIMECFLQFTNSEIEPDDRILVFFAGHGTTKYGRRGEIGYLIPYDAQPNNLASFIRWDDLTKNSELIKAKHMLFVMDACYGGLALNRALRPGSMRFLKDMFRRYTRQVLTAGKADEPVLDAGGPLPNHSIFTGHFLEGLQGKAATRDGIITANGIMAYVYERVAKDYQSIQTPHYGFLDGDGDFIFTAPVLEELLEESEVEMDNDILISIPAAMTTEESDINAPLLSKAKEYIADIRYRVKLHDLTIQELRKVLTLLSEQNFPRDSPPVSTETLIERLKKYENVSYDLQSVFCIISHWGAREHTSIISKVVSHLFDERSYSGIRAWLSLRFYPVMILMYSGGIGAIASNNYENLVAILTTNVGATFTNEGSQEAILEMGNLCAEIEQQIFKRLPDHEKHYVPRSEYLFKLLQPKLDDILFLGRNYEELFDRFEVMFALIHADLMYQSKERVWGPLGRFAWKHRTRTNSIYATIVKEAQIKQASWPPFQAGLFGGSYERFQKVATEFEQLIDRVSWH